MELELMSFSQRGRKLIILNRQKCKSSRLMNRLTYPRRKQMRSCPSRVSMMSMEVTCLLRTEGVSKGGGFPWSSDVYVHNQEKRTSNDTDRVNTHPHIVVSPCQFPNCVLHIPLVILYKKF